MTMKTNKTLLTISIAWMIGLPSCVSDQNTPQSGNTQNFTEWLIPVAEVRDGGPGKDGIPALDSPELIPASQVDFLEDNDLVLGFVDGQDIRAYPHKILDWHEIINENLPSGKKLSVIYCPLTGTGIGWERRVDGRETTFGVSGLLYNTNIIPYDRATDSNWSQMLFKSVNGPLAGTEAKTYSMIETTWSTWKEMYPSSQVVSLNTGFNRSYKYPYGDYRSNQEFILFPVSRRDDRLPNKQRVLGVIINEKLKVYDIDTFGSQTETISDQFENKELIIVGNKDSNFILAFENSLNGSPQSFQPVQNQLPIIMQDQLGNQYDVNGRVVSGPSQGSALLEVRRMMSYWFSWASFYPDIELYQSQ